MKRISLTTWIFIGMAAGVALGIAAPEFAKQLGPVIESSQRRQIPQRIHIVNCGWGRLGSPSQAELFFSLFPIVVMQSRDSAEHSMRAGLGREKL